MCTREPWVSQRRGEEGAQQRGRRRCSANVGRRHGDSGCGGQEPSGSARQQRSAVAPSGGVQRRPSGGAQRRCPAAVPSDRARPERPAWYLFRARVRSLGGRAAPASPASRPLASPSRSPPLRRCEGERAGERAFEKKRGTDGGATVLLARLGCGRRVCGGSRVFVRPLHRHPCRESVPSSCTVRNGSEERGSA